MTMLMSISALLFHLVTYYGQPDPDLHRWFEMLHTTMGGYCCAESDGIKMDDPDWGKDQSGYWVMLNKVKVPVPDGKVVHDRNPKVGFAVVWRMRGWDGEPTVRCFLPGPTT